MSKAEPTIQKYMTTQPISIEAGQTLQDAIMVLKQHSIRHLPVMRGNEVVGLLSDRDVKLALGIQGLDTDRMPVIDICIEKPYTVKPEAHLKEVALTMASKHYGSAIVVSNGKLVGIFTTVDACRALAEIIDTRYHD